MWCWQLLLASPQMCQGEFHVPPEKDDWYINAHACEFWKPYLVPRQQINMGWSHTLKWLPQCMGYYILAQVLDIINITAMICTSGSGPGSHRHPANHSCHCGHMLGSAYGDGVIVRKRGCGRKEWANQRLTLIFGRLQSKFSLDTRLSFKPCTVQKPSQHPQDLKVYNYTMLLLQR